MTEAKTAIREFYYITHTDNIHSILAKGIFSHEQITMQKLPYTPIYDDEIVVRRSMKLAPNGKDLWSFANLFFNARNAMLYRVISEKDKSKIAVLAISKGVLDIPGVYVTTGNAANDATEIKPVSELNETYRSVKKDLERIFWSDLDGSKRRMMAECLVPDNVPPNFINSIYVTSHEAAADVRRKVPKMIPVIPQPDLFFQALNIYRITPNLTLAEGDMFFSRCQTITISVNCVGIMGKGIASRAKYQFPDVYVHYQDTCRNGQLKMGKPHLYKRETSIDYELADDPSTLKNPNRVTWFLLFATKQDWKNNADITGIEEGLRWLLKNYEKEGIASLAIPALGCGLGNLSWEQVGPLMSRYLSQMKIPVSIYLPLEKPIPGKQLTPDFLLGH